MIYRDRFTVDPVATGTWSVTKIGSGSFTCANPATYTIPDFRPMYEYFEEEGGGRRNDNSCYHIKLYTEVPRTPYTYGVSSTNSQVNYCRFTNNDPDRQWRAIQGPNVDSGTYGLFGGKGLDSFNVIGNSELEQAKEDGLISMWPRIKAGLLSLNSLYELKDFKKLPSLFRRLSTYSDAVEILRRNWRIDPVLRKRWTKSGLRAVFAREGVRLGSEAYLTNEFGIKPLLADITAVNTALLSYKNQLRKLIEEQGQRRTIYYSRPLSSMFPESDTSTLVPVTNYYNGIRFYRKVERIQEPTFRCRMDYSYTLPQYSATEYEVRALLDSLGVNLNPQIIWNALPWSFVVDWLVGVNRWLGNTRVNNIEPEVTIYRYCWSLKAARRVTLKTKYAGGGPESPTVTNRTYEEYHYKRDTRMPDWAAYVKTSGLNLKEFSYIGALIGAR